MKPAQVLTLVRKLALRHDLTIEELSKRGKGSHRIFVLVDSNGNEVGRLGLTGHTRDLSWKVLENAEQSLAHLFGEKWTPEAMTSYEVTVTREDNLWVAIIAGAGATDVEHFADLDVEVRDYIAGITDGDPDDFAVQWRYEVNGHDVTEALSRFMAAERELREVMEKEAAKTAERRPSQSSWGFRLGWPVVTRQTVANERCHRRRWARRFGGWLLGPGNATPIGAATGEQRPGAGSGTAGRHRGR